MTLDDVRADAFARFSRGVSDRGSPFRTPAFATVDALGHPSVRTVVLRAFDPASRVLCVHTDLRAAKMDHLRARPSVALHVWDEADAVQIRVVGRATLHVGDERARAEWAGLHPGIRATYTVRPTPGTPLADPAEADRDRVDEGAAHANFAAVDVVMHGLDWLHLASGGHRRARFEWRDGQEVATWIVP